MRNALIQIEDKMVHSNWMPSIIILGINRGGCIPGVYLSHRLERTAHEALRYKIKRSHRQSRI